MKEIWPKHSYVIITGGAGYIGSHTAVELWDAGYTPIIVDNFSNTTIDNIKGIEEIIGQEVKYFEADCTDVDELNEVFKSVQTLGGHDSIVGVIHFAAFKSVGDSVLNPEKYHKNNIGSLETLIGVMYNLNVNNLIFSSSCSVYGNSDILPVTEETPFKPAESPYAETKQLCEEIVAISKLNSVSLRYFNPIGSHESSLIGDRSIDKPAAIVPVLCKSVIDNTEMLVHGDNYDTKDGTCIRDYIHVVDLAKSHVSSLDYLIGSEGKHVYNVGTGNGVSVFEAIESFEESNNLKVNYKIGPRRAGDIIEIYADCSKINNELKWSTEKTLKHCMKDSWNWELNKIQNSINKLTSNQS